MCHRFIVFLFVKLTRYSVYNELSFVILIGYLEFCKQDLHTDFIGLQFYDLLYSHLSKELLLIFISVHFCHCCFYFDYECKKIKKVY